MAPAFVAELPVGKFHGVGPVTAAKMKKLGIHTGLDLRRQTREFLTAQFGKAGDLFCRLARAEDDRPVVTSQPRKSLGAETTFVRDLVSWEEVAPALEPLFAKLWAASRRHGLTAHTVTVKIKYANFRLITRSNPVPRRSHREGSSRSSVSTRCGHIFRRRAACGCSGLRCPTLPPPASPTAAKPPWLCNRTLITGGAYGKIQPSTNRRGGQ